MSFYLRAQELKSELIMHRRTIHQFAEVGMELPKTTEYVMTQLKNMGYEPKEIIHSGIVATVGNKGKTVLLRADMDALPMPEDTGLAYAAENGNCHACGHDAHTAMLLCAARLLKEKETELKGTIKFMFQPGEELLRGAAAMIEAGVLENPKVDRAMALHIRSTDPKGISYVYGARAASAGNFIITIHGAATHGAMPYNGVDPIVVGSHVVLGLQELISREISFTKGAVLTIGQFTSGSSSNVIPATAEIKGTMRSFHNETQKHMVKRVPEIVEAIAGAYRATIKFEWLCDVPVLVNDETFTHQIRSYIEDLSDGHFDVSGCEPTTGSEDFALLANSVPSSMFSLCAPHPDETMRYPLHNPKVMFDEDFLPAGAAVLADSAARWLADHS